MRQCLGKCFGVRIRKEVKQVLDPPGELLMVSLQTWSNSNYMNGLNLGSNNYEKKIY